MALRRVVSALRRGSPRLAPLSTAPATREQPAADTGAAPGCGAAEALRPPVPAVDFGNTREAYRSRRSWELARSLLVLRLCASPALLARHEQVRRGKGRRRGGAGSSARRGALAELRCHPGLLGLAGSAAGQSGGARPAFRVRPEGSHRSVIRHNREQGPVWTSSVLVVVLRVPCT